MLYSWGRGEDGQCGNGSTHDQELPTPVEGLKHQTVVQIACGSGTERGGKEGRKWLVMPLDVLNSRLVDLFHFITGLRAHIGHTVVLTEDKDVWSWGRGDDGRLVSKGGREGKKERRRYMEAMAADNVIFD